MRRRHPILPGFSATTRIEAFQAQKGMILPSILLLAWLYCKNIELRQSLKQHVVMVGTIAHSDSVVCSNSFERQDSEPEVLGTRRFGTHGGRVRDSCVVRGSIIAYRLYCK